MNLDQIETKCFILALFIRDDGERFLLGSRAYEFKDSQLHFVGNMYQNDVVEVQGNDGVMLAGQVRRGNTQAFDGYIGDSTVDRQTIEQYRRDFMKFFRKNHYYKVVYVLPDGSAVQRRNGFIVEAPEVKELYQLFPEYHIGINFEDINYYIYEEDSEGEEIYGESATLKIVSSASGGLIWDENSEVSLSGEGVNFTLEGTVDGTVLSDVQLKGDTTQQTYSGKNLINNYDLTFDYSNVGASYTTLTTLPTGIRYKTTYIEGGPSIIFKLLDLTPYKNKVIRIRANFSSKGGISMVLCNSNVTTRNIVAETMTSGAEISYTVPNDLGNTPYLAYRLRISPATGNDTVDFTDLILTIDNADMTYEPYTGGIPAPNPSYPQTVNTVTGRQVVTISDGGSQSQSYEVNLGKNLLDMNLTENGGINTSGVDISASDNWRTVGYINAEPNTAYTYSMNGTLSQGYVLRFYQYDSNYNFISPRIEGINNTITVTTGANTRYIRLVLYSNVGTMTQAIAEGAKLMLELGSTATSYAPYFEPIELCKIGDYQDYIYKSGDDWYVHKAIQKQIFDGTESWQTWGTGVTGVYRWGLNLSSLIVPVASNNNLGYIKSESYVTETGNNTNANHQGIAVQTTGYISIYDNNRNSDLNAFKTWLGTNNVVVYYALITATDTQITNADLIAQLNALAGATTYDGSTSFTVDGNGNLAAILAVEVEASGGGGVEWDNYGAVWEEGTGGGPTMIDVDSIDNVYPVWTVTGPAVNPQISVLTTNTTLSYSGTVTASQELKIDMFNKTATLNGASVVGNVSGDWVYLKPGVNRITYTTNNADAPDSTIWWQEIVG